MLILGAAGAGKSSLALELMALGATLVADDRTQLRRDGDLLTAEAPSTISGLIEARGIGILRTQSVVSAPVVLVVDLDRTVKERMPEPMTRDICGITFPCLPRVEGSHLAATALLCLKGALRSAHD